jgi:hypothetical protein
LILQNWHRTPEADLLELDLKLAEDDWHEQMANSKWFEEFSAKQSSQQALVMMSPCSESVAADSQSL